MENKILLALDYISKRREAEPTTAGDIIKNDAANIYAENFDEYTAIYNAIKNA